MKKSYKLNFNYDEKIESISTIFGLSKEGMEALMKRFERNLEVIAVKKPHFHLADVLEAAIKAAENDTELAYVFFRVGKEHEQQNMAQAAKFAERIIIPGILRTKNEKKILN